MKPTYLSFPINTDAGVIEKAINEIKQESPTERTLLITFPDGSIRLVAQIVKLDDCPQDVFEEAMELFHAI